MNGEQYTPKQMANAEKLAQLIGTLSEEKQATVAMMATAFISGMEAQARMSARNTSIRPSA